MAKITGLSGMIRGKSGPNVFRISRGVQTMSQYNPNPNNPNTEAQRTRRSIFGTAAKLAKACYDDEIAGPLFKSISYKQRNELISKIIKTEESFEESPALPLIISASAVRENWLPAFGKIPLLGGSYADDNITISCFLPDDGALPTIDGFIVALLARPLPGMTFDDLELYSLPPNYVFQANVYYPASSITPGNIGSATVPVSDFTYINSISPFQMGPESGGLTNDMKEYRCWYIIPFSFTYTGSGLEIEIDGNLASVGKVQILWSSGS